MKKIIVMLATIFILFCGNTLSFGQTVSEEAKRHFDRGIAAIEMASSPDDYIGAIEEFEQAARLAPNWPDVYYNLGKVQEKAQKYREAIGNLQQYLRLAPSANDAEAVKGLINKLEFRAEQFISDSEALDIFASLGGYRGNNSKWNFTGDISPRGFAQKFWRVGDKIEFQFWTPRDQYLTRNAQVKGRILEYDSYYIYSTIGSGVELSLKVVMEIVSRARIKGSAVETGWIDGHENIFEFEYILK